jgi:hypothetical protein
MRKAMTNHDDELQGILEDCARLRGCYPLMNRIESQFLEWLMTEKRNYITPFAEEFYNHCVDMYDHDINRIIKQVIEEQHETLQKLASNPKNICPVYFCPRCNKVVTEVYIDTVSTGIVPKCSVCDSLLQWHYEICDL